MADNAPPPSLSPSSEKGSSSQSPRSFATLSSGSPIIVGANRSYMPITLNNNKPLSLLSPSPLSPSPAPGVFGVLPREPVQQVQPQAMVAPVKRRRGRPPGSKNKSKVPMIIFKDTDHLLKPTVIEVPDGTDVIDAIINFAHSHHFSVSVLSVSGSISEATLRYPFSHAPTISVRGKSPIVSLSGTYINTLLPSQAPIFTHSSFAIQIADSNTNKIYGGLVGGRVIAAGPVVVLLSKFKKHEYHRLNSSANVHLSAPKNGDFITNNNANANVSTFSVATPVVPDSKFMQWKKHDSNY
ncbi:AT-hook motif nuclear-localized protein 28-like [Abrus precatorius]|uniref:AT-hook motif nuclear-localized protein 28-like n=1 Tax=Abrus precatorius TaxID=3816 RepID=A0A8B8MMU8_ABRPR|nr:AT-hook motif nuclear-localized protein 28-like [Abrus precatorius]